jgi:hypothetical protein
VGPGFEYQVRKKHEKTFSVQTPEMASDARLDRNDCYVLAGQTQLHAKISQVESSFAYLLLKEGG